MTNNEAEKLARDLMRRNAGQSVLVTSADLRKLCHAILSGSMKREIENAAYRRAGKIARRFGCGVPGCTACYAGAAAEKILALIGDDPGLDGTKLSVHNAGSLLGIFWKCCRRGCQCGWEILSKSPLATGSAQT